VLLELLQLVPFVQLFYKLLYRASYL
jgi:hypothetical protein